MIKLIKCNVFYSDPEDSSEEFINPAHIVSIGTAFNDDDEYAQVTLVEVGEVTINMTREEFIAKIGAEVLDIT